MAAYCTQADLETRYGADEVLQLADRDGDGVADTGVIEAAIADAGNEIDGYLAGVASLPLASVPPLLARLACDLARFGLWRDGASERVRQGAQDARAALADIARGRIRLPDADGAQPTASGAATLRVTARTRVFSDDALAGY